jgi:DNA topoisomerase-3
MKLYICEKPSQARDLARNLNINSGADGYIGNGNEVVTFAIGHLIQQFTPNDIDERYKHWNVKDLPIVPNQWQMKANPKTAKQLKVVGRLINKASEIIISTDGDREGEVIGRELLDYFNYTGSIKRLWLTALDDNSIQKSLQNIKSGQATKSLYDAGLGRARSDWLAGMNLTVAMTKKAQSSGFSGVLSIGRVQTPTLAMIVNRDIEIEDFKSKDYYEVHGVFNSIAAKRIINKATDTDFLDKENRIIFKDYANTIISQLKDSRAVVDQVETNRKKTKAPLLFSLSQLQQVASKKYGLSAKEVLDSAQALYETHKATTYPRSDCQYLPVSQFSEVKGVMGAISSIDSDMGKLIAQADLSIQSRIWNDKKLGAHHAIIPTTAKVNITKMSNHEFKIYDLIRRYYLANFYPDYEYDLTDIKIKVGAGDIFTTSGTVLVENGWKNVISDSKKEDKVLPNVKVGDALNIDHLEVQTKKTTPPKRYTEGTLIAAMEKAHLYVTDEHLKKILKGNEGIGTPATRANIIETLKQRDFITEDKKSLISTQIGKTLISMVPIEIKDAGSTAIMEARLTQITNKELELDEFVKTEVDRLNNLLQIISKLKLSAGDLGVETVECPACKGQMTLRAGQYGKYWACTNYPNCKTTAKDHKGKPVLQKKTDDFKCPECEKPLRRIKGKKGFFWSCAGYFDKPKCPFTAKDKNKRPILKHGVRK